MLSIPPQLEGLRGWALLALLAVVLLYAVNWYISIPLPKGIDLIREPPGARSFSLRTRSAYYIDCASMIREAYENYAKKDKAVVIPGVGLRSELVLPNSSMRWALSQPDDVLSGAEATADFGYIYHALGTKAPILDPWQGMLVKKDMNNVLEAIAMALEDELGVAFDHYFGTDTSEWKEVELGPAIRRIIAQAASRFTVGVPLCRDQDYLDTCMRIVDAFVMHLAVSSFAPAVLLPVLGRLSGLRMKYLMRRLKKLLGPLYHERLELLKHDKNDPGHDEPLDHFQMMMRYAQAERPRELELDMMTKRVAVANLGSFHQTSIQTVNILLNVLDSDPEFNTIAVLRDEAARVLGGQHPAWTRPNVARMTRSDSAMRETLRMQQLGVRNLIRKVMVDGLVTDGGVCLPKGANVGFLGQPTHYDGEKYEEPGKFDPFRFSRVREASEGAAAAAAAQLGGGTAVKGGTASAFVSTSPDFLPFGNGRHACPGRFLVDFELKMIITYVLTNYDVRFPDSYGGTRPPTVWKAEMQVPPDDVKIMVRRKVV